MAAEPAYLGEIHEPVALPVNPVRSADQFERLGKQCLWPLVLAVTGEEFRLHAPPQELRSHVVRGGEFPADPSEFGRLLVATLAVRDLAKHARSRGDVVAFSHLVKRPVSRAELVFRRLQIVGEYLDGGRVKGGERGEEPPAEFLKQCTAPPVTDPGHLEVAPHRLEMR